MVIGAVISPDKYSGRPEKILTRKRFNLNRHQKKLLRIEEPMELGTPTHMLDWG